MWTWSCHQLPVVGRFVRERLNGDYVRDEAMQDRELAETLRAASPGCPARATRAMDVATLQVEQARTGPRSPRPMTASATSTRTSPSGRKSSNRRDARDASRLALDVTLAPAVHSCMQHGLLRIGLAGTAWEPASGAGAAGDFEDDAEQQGSR